MTPPRDHADLAALGVGRIDEEERAGPVVKSEAFKADGLKARLGAGAICEGDGELFKLGFGEACGIGVAEFIEGNGF